MKSLRREYREREKAAVTAILEKADVVMATLTGSSEDGPLKHLPKGHFDLVVIDECSQVSNFSAFHLQQLVAYFFVVAGSCLLDSIDICSKMHPSW